ncbi:hypothetical protein V8E51_001433 [Hyaloscypha variabilis]
MTEVTAPEPSAIYVTANSRGQPGTFHWGIFVSFSGDSGRLYHAINHTSVAGVVGPWRFEYREINNFLTSRSLVALYRIGKVGEGSLQAVQDTIMTVPADGEPSRRTGQTFTCRIWTGDVLVALHNASLIVLTKSIVLIACREAEIEVDVTWYASQFEQQVITGQRSAAILHNTEASQS